MPVPPLEAPALALPPLPLPVPALLDVPAELVPVPALLDVPAVPELPPDWLAEPAEPPPGSSSESPPQAAMSAGTKMHVKPKNLFMSSLRWMRQVGRAQCSREGSNQSLRQQAAPGQFPDHAPEMTST